MIVNVQLETVNNMENKQLILLSSVTNEEMEHNEWLKEAMNIKLKNALVGPIIALNGLQEQQVRHQRLIEVFTHDDIAPQFLFMIPGQLIQFILPLDHLLVSIVFLKNPKGGMDLKVRINKLTIANYDTAMASEND